jgi:hypothetical protein
MKINMFRMHTFSHFSGAREYLKAMVRAIPDAKARELADLRQFAESNGWDHDDYECERQELEGLFEYTMPDVLIRSFLIYLHSIVEVQLYSVADHLRKREQVDLRVTELAGSPIEKARVFFSKILKIQIGDNFCWAHLRDLAEFRHVIVHRGARIGADQDYRRKLQQRAERYPGVTASRGWDQEDSELICSVDACLWFVDMAEKFFDHLFAQSGLGTTWMEGSGR